MIPIARRALGQRIASVQPTRATSIHLSVVSRRFNSTEHQPINNHLPRNLTKIPFGDAPELIFEGSDCNKINWSESFQGLSSKPFPKEVADILQSPVDADDVEIAFRGLVYIPYAKYLEILNKAFGAGGWKIVPRGEPIVARKVITREYALICHDRLVSIARGEKGWVMPDEIPAATEDCKSSALTRCCKDLGIASELWDRRWVGSFKKKYCEQIWVEDQSTGKKSIIWMRKGTSLEPPYKVSSSVLPSDPQTYVCAVPEDSPRQSLILSNVNAVIHSDLVRQVRSGLVPVDFEAVRQAKQSRELEDPKSGHEEIEK